MYIDKLDHIVYKYNNTYYSTMKVKPIDIKPSRCSADIEATKALLYLGTK